MKQHSVDIPARAVRLGADFTIPDRPSGVIVFAHGSGSSRFSTRDRHVAKRLNAAGFAARRCARPPSWATIWMRSSRGEVARTWRERRCRA